MSSSTHNLLFYSSHPGDTLSQEILQELQKNELLKDQFATFCVNSPGIKLPRMIIEKNEVPIIITRGFNKPISGEAALNWIKEHNSGKAVGLDYGDIEKSAQVSEDHGVLCSESGRTSYQQAFNDEYNAGADSDTRSINTAFSNISDMNNMETLEEQGRHNTKGLKTDIDKKLKNLNMQRQQEVPQPLRRDDSGRLPLNEIGRASDLRGGEMKMNFPPMQSTGGPMFPSSNRGQVEQTPPQYNPYSPGGIGGGNLGRPMGPLQPLNQPQDNRFPPIPQQNPLYPPPRSPTTSTHKAGYPELPPGFGNMRQNQGSGQIGQIGGMNSGMNSQFSSFGDAFSGQTLIGTPMHQSGSKFNTRREKMLTPGLPGGHGHGGPFQAMSTSQY